MVEVVNRNQQVVTTALQPRALYSRTVNLYLCIDGGLGNEDIQITPVLGNNLWLLEVKLTCMPHTVVLKGQAFIYIQAGAGQNPTVDELLNAWDAVIPNYGTAKPAFQFYGKQQQFTWQMCKRYTGKALRFASIVENLSDIVRMRFWVSFTFSEG